MITAIILTKKGEENIEKCLKSVEFCDEIIIVDDSDGGLHENKGYRIRILHRKVWGDFAGQRNWAMKQAKGDWVLFVDADETVSPELQKEIVGEIRENKGRKGGYYIKRREWFWGRKVKYGEIATARDKGIIRLVKKDKEISPASDAVRNDMDILNDNHCWQGKIHEVFVTDQATGQLKNYIDHYPHQTISEFLHHINFYSSLRANELYKQGKKTNIFSIIIIPLFKFKYTYLIKLGFLDGVVGFIYSFMMAYHSFLVRGKLYLLTNSNNTVGSASK